MGAALWPTVALCLTLSAVSCESNLTILSLPVNVTSWSLALKSALNYSLVDQLEGLGRTLRGYVDFVRNGSIGCSLEGEQCIPGTPSCCPAIKENDTDLTCQEKEGLYVCHFFNDSEELTQQRLDDLEYGDSNNGVGSHPWTEDWAFQSRSAIEREEDQAAEEALWKKNWIPTLEDNIWMRTYGKLKRGGHEIWHDLRKLKKLRELKEQLIDKYKARVARIKEGEKVTNEQENKNTIMYPDEGTEGENYETGNADDRKIESEESVIKFSDEIPPKKDNKIDFRLDDIIQNAVNLVGQKFKKTIKPSKSNLDTLDSQMFLNPSEETPISVQNIEGTEEKLRREIEDLKALRKLKEHTELNNEIANEPNIDELIRSQVSAILEEERKLDKLRKIQELRRIEQGINQKS